MTSADKGPVVLYQPSTLNRYVYGNLDPVNHIDPTGNETLPIGFTRICGPTRFSYKAFIDKIQPVYNDPKKGDKDWKTKVNAVYDSVLKWRDICGK